MDETPLTLEGVKEAVRESHSQAQGALKREMDSLDDFEHLGHDSSPLAATKEAAGDLLSGLQTEPAVAAARDFGIDNSAAVGAAASKFTDHGDLSSFDPLSSSQPKKMDNLLDFGDSGGFPDRQQADEKLDKFLQDMSSPFNHPPKQEEPKHDFDSFMSTKSFMDNERGFSDSPHFKEFESPAKSKPIHSNNETDRYLEDSEPEDEFSQPIKPHKTSDPLPDTFGSFHKTQDAFKDVEEDFMAKKETPAPPQTTHSIVRPSAPAPEPPKEVKLPEPVKEAPKAELPKPKEEPKKASVPVCKPKANRTDAEAIFCKMGLDAWFNPERLNPKVESLIYWRDPKKSGPVFGGVLVVLLALTYFSLISVVAYLSLAALVGTIAFRIYKNIIQAVQKTGDGHPFKDLLEFDITLPQDKVKEIVEIAVAHVNAAAVELRRLFLVEDLVDSIKFGVLLWILTYLGAWFNGMTLIIIAWVALFTLPKVYETNKTQIDANLEIVRTKIAEITSKVKAAIPIGKKEEKKEQ